MTKKTQEIDVAVLKQQVKDLDENVKLILNNHLPHLHDQIDDIRIRIATWTGSGIVLLALLQLILKFFFK